MLETISDSVPAMVQAVLENTDRRPGWRFRWGLVVSTDGTPTLARRTTSSPRSTWIDLPRVDHVTYGLPGWLFGRAMVVAEGSKVRKIREDAARDGLARWARQLFTALGPAMVIDRPGLAPCRTCGDETGPIVALVDVHVCRSCFENAS